MMVRNARIICLQRNRQPARVHRVTPLGRYAQRPCETLLLKEHSRAPGGNGSRVDLQMSKQQVHW